MERIQEAVAKSEQSGKNYSFHLCQATKLDSTHEKYIVRLDDGVYSEMKRC